MRSISAGEHLRAEIERFGFTQGEVADVLGVTRQTINNVINDRYAISRPMAGKLGRLTQRSSDYWLHNSFPVAREPRVPAKPSRRPVKTTKPAVKPMNGESFNSFVRRLPRTDGDGDLLRSVSAKGFPAVQNWGQLRAAVRRIDDSDAMFVAARRLWRRYKMT